MKKTYTKAEMEVLLHLGDVITQSPSGDGVPGGFIGG